MWFPLVDATTTLSRLEVILKNGDIGTPFDKDLDNLGQAYQSMKKLHNPDVLESWASKVISMKFEFISYRIADGTKSAFFRVSKQIAKGCAVYWDRWSLPRRLSERREFVSDEALDAFLMSKIIESKVVWGIESPRYAEVGSYSKKEKELAEKIGNYQHSDLDLANKAKKQGRS